jgi:hypothetical protein
MWRRRSIIRAVRPFGADPRDRAGAGAFCYSARDSVNRDGAQEEIIGFSGEIATLGRLPESLCHFLS